MYLPIAPPTFCTHKAVEHDPDRAWNQAKRDVLLRREVQRVWDQNFEVYGVCKVRHQIRCEGFDVARCTVERLVCQLGIQGAMCGTALKTTESDKVRPCLRDKMNRKLLSNASWVSKFAYVSTWLGFVYLAFVVDNFVNRVVDW